MRFARLPLTFASFRHAPRGVLFPVLFLFLTFSAAFPVASFAANAAASTGKATAQTRKRPIAKKTKAKPEAKTPAPAATATQAPAAPAVPKMPDWPLNNRSVPATVAWNAGGLRIEANNSSLRQILNEVSTLTGTKVEGLSNDERVYGVFGPGPARDVLTHLFDGSGYNLLLIGDQGQGTPRQLILTTRGSGSTGAIPAARSVVAQSDDDDAVEEPSQQAPPPPSVRNNFGEPRPPQGQNGPGGQPDQPPQNQPGVPPQQQQSSDSDD